MQAIHRDAWVRQLVHVQPLNVIGAHGRIASTPTHVHCTTHGSSSTVAAASRQSPPKRVVAGCSHALRYVPQPACARKDALAPDLLVHVKNSQQVKEDEEVRQRRERRRSLRQNPETCLPSIWTRAFDLNPEEPLLGGGAFAKILRVTEKSTGQAYAMKVMNRPSFVMRGIEMQVDAEIDAMRRCAQNHWCRHVVRLFDTIEENDYVYIRLELCSCDLLRFANGQPGSRLTETDGMIWTQQLLTGLRDLHCLGIIHRDIKPENLLCTAEGTLKIADFGWCADVRDGPSTMAGTFQYMAPEILGHMGVQTEAVDVWSAGVTMLQLLQGRQLLTTYLGPGSTGLSVTDPHQATKVKTSRLLAEIGERCPPAEEARPAHITSRCWDLLRRTLIPEVESRVSVSEALGHLWLQDAPGQHVISDMLVRGPAEAQDRDNRTEASTSSTSMPILQAPTPINTMTPGRSPCQRMHLQASPAPFKQVLVSSPAMRSKCQRSESAPKYLHSEWTPMGSSRLLPSDPPSPHTALTARVLKLTVCRSQTRERWSHAVDNTCTAGNIDGGQLCTPVQQDCCDQKAKCTPQLVSAKVGEQEGYAHPFTEDANTSTFRVPKTLSRHMSARRTSFTTGDETRNDVSDSGHGSRIGCSAVARLQRRPEGSSQGSVLVCQATPPASSAGSGYFPSTSNRDSLSRSSPPEVIKALTPRMPLLPVWRDKDPLEGNQSPPRVQRHTATGDALLRTAVVVRPWQVTKSANVTAKATMQLVHGMSVSTPALDSSWISPRPLVSSCRTRTLRTSQPATPGWEAFRDVGPQRTTRVSTFAATEQSSTLGAIANEGMCKHMF